ncbi:hypothetical protein [Azospirillum rugosum]|uniref:Uncharacterized protein n=1 Tax=Azospirillum rugosum TaxID=416170 RepID=A0ABS4SP27_9PROT|nr:hypothetical protein [Azospirillum rugosum]MBP2294314.1 hypothetical protein [Azospirillum rugosum]MDQ0527649.1 hypothetical protein [Azospirillum rugosum]
MVLKPFRHIDDIPIGCRVVLFGCGSAGQAFRRYLEIVGRPASAFIDSRLSGDVDGLPVHRLADYAACGCRPGDQVVVTSSYVWDIARLLSAHGITGALNAAAFAVNLGAHRDRLLGMVEDGRLMVVPARDPDTPCRN